MSSVDFQGFNLSKNNTYIYLGDKNTVSEWLILGAVLLPEAQIRKIREFKPRKPLSYSEYWANYRLHRLWLYALLPSNLWNALHQKKKRYITLEKGLKAQTAAWQWPIVSSELTEDPAAWEGASSSGRQCLVRHQCPFQLSTAFAWLHLRLRLEQARFLCSASYVFIKATSESS